MAVVHAKMHFCWLTSNVNSNVISVTPFGLYCKAGDFYIDPSRRVDRAVVTHAHSDHAYRGMAAYLAHEHSEPLLRHRLGKHITVQTLRYAEPLRIGNATVSLHPSGHMLGAAQVRVEVGGEVWVVTGDYKREVDPLAANFEVVPCNTLITECTFGLPVYQWRNPTDIVESLNSWWRANANAGMVSVVRAYSFGKAQRILLSLDHSIGPVFANQSVHDANVVIRSAGHALPPTPLLTRERVLASLNDGGNPSIRRALVIAAGGVDAALAGLPYTVADASGWVLVRKFRQQRTGFPISDHADWPGLLQTVANTGCERVLAMHGFTEPFTRYLRERGLDAQPLEGGGRGLPLALTEDADWLRQACIQHVGVAAEAEALMRGENYVPRSSRATQLGNASVAAEERWNEQPTAVVRCVLMHLHRRPGESVVHTFTMGVWKGDTLVPLTHVDATADEALMFEIRAWAETHTTIRVGPVRTIEPRFVFEVEVQGVSINARRKVGVSIRKACIKSYLGINISKASNQADVQALVGP